LVLALAGTLIGLVSPTLARQGPSSAGPDAQARQYEQTALAAFDAGRYRDAITAYVAAYNLDNQTKYLFNIGLAYQKLDELDKALEYYERFIRDEPNPARKRLARKKAAEIQRTSTPVRLIVNVGGALIKIGAQELGRSPLPRPVRLRNGVQRLQVSAPGYQDHAREVDIGPRRSSTIRIELKAASVGPLPEARRVEPPPARMPPVARRVEPPPARMPPAARRVEPPPAPRQAPKARNQRLLIVGIVTGAIAVGAEAGALGLFGSFRGGKSTTNHTAGYAYYGLHAAAGLLAVTAAVTLVLHFTHGRKAERVAKILEHGFTPSLVIGDHGAVVGITGRY
jgi:tetratricopeptide (TPR) repeat protein